MKQRNQTIDLAKGIAIILMVFGHCYEGDNVISRWIYAFHMPFFFLISGMLYAGKWQKGVRFAFPATAKKLLIPYFVFDTLFTAFILILGRTDDFAGSFLDVLQHQIIPLTGKTVTWYLPCYLLVLCIFVVAAKHSGKQFVVLLSVGLYLIGILVPVPNGLFQVWRSLVATGFFAIGYYAKKCFSSKCATPWVTAASVLFLWLSYCNGRVGLAGLQFSNPLLYTANSLLGSWLLIQFSMRMQANRWTNWIIHFGKNTVIVLCTHMFVLEITRVLEHKLLGNALNGIWIAESFIVGGIVVVLMFPMIAFCNRFCSGLFGK